MLAMPPSSTSGLRFALFLGRSPARTAATSDNSAPPKILEQNRQRLNGWLSMGQRYR
jgi:hypothetical protein